MKMIVKFNAIILFLFGFTPAIAQIATDREIYTVALNHIYRQIINKEEVGSTCITISYQHVEPIT